MKTIIRLLVLVLFFCININIVHSKPSSTGASFNPVPIAVKPAGSIPIGTIIYWPSNSNPADTEKWLECNGQSVNRTKYPKLYALMSSTPDLRGYFLRGLTSGHSILEAVGDTLKSHTSRVPSHTHQFTGGLTSPSLSGTAAAKDYKGSSVLTVTGNAEGQAFSTNVSLNVDGTTSSSNFTVTGKTDYSYTVNEPNSSSSNLTVTGVNGESGTPYEYNYNLTKETVLYNNATTKQGKITTTVSGTIPERTVSGSAEGTITGTASKSDISGTATGAVSGRSESSSITGNVNNGTVKGSGLNSVGMTAYYTGGAETAPTHTYMRYLIRAVD